LVGVVEYRVGNELWPHVELMEEPLRAELQRYAAGLGLSADELDRLEDPHDPAEAARSDPAALAELERRRTIVRRELVDRRGREWVGHGPLPNTPRGEYQHALDELTTP